MNTLHAQDFNALLVDLDGVITKTAVVHASAWKRLFDEFLKRRAATTNEPFEPFDIERDYRKFVDGLPRYKGVEAFLQSRGIPLPYGSPADDPEQETVCGLGNRKNRYFQEHLDAEGVERYEPAVNFLQKAKDNGFKCAVVSSSKNCKSIVEKADLTPLFDVRVDGLDIAQLGLEGKPDPDMFLEAAKRLGVQPERAVVLEDAISGVEAGKKGGFGLVVGVNRSHRTGTLRNHGADWEISDFETVTIEPDEKPDKKDHQQTIPSALEHMEDIAHLFKGKLLAVFLDYDGTLTPIVDRPEAAILSEAMRRTIRRLGALCPVAVISGRDRENVQKLVNVDNVTYAGSHGFDIAGPRNLHLQHDEGRRCQPALQSAGKELSRTCHDIQGVKIEEKAFAVTVHFRLVEATQVPDIKGTVVSVAQRYPELRVTGGKQILELRPAIDWDKGRAVAWLMDSLGGGGDIVPVYIGDDETDEDAFAVLKEIGIGIMVAEDPKATQARYWLADPDGVQTFLSRLITILERRKS